MNTATTPEKFCTKTRRTGGLSPFLAILLAFSGMNVSLRADDVGGENASPPAAKAGDVLDGTILCTTKTEDGFMRASLVVKPKRVRLSDTLTLILRLDYDETIRPVAPEFGETLGDFDIVSREQRFAAPYGGRTVREFVLTLTPQRIGSIDIWPIPLAYARQHDADSGKLHTLTLPASRIEVFSPLSPDKVSLDDIASEGKPLAFPHSATNIILAALLVLAVTAALVVAACRSLKNKPRRETVPTLDLGEIARERLRQLVESHIHESDVRRFYIELTAIVRWYIEQVTNVRAPERTTEEFLREIGNAPFRHPLFDRRTQERLRDFLHDCDLVKFAKARPGPEEIMNGYHSACRFVSLGDESEDAKPPV